MSERPVKAFHYELKAGVFEDQANGYAIGDYKKRPNFVGNMKTAMPEDVGLQMFALTEWYHSIRDKNLETIATFHAGYESIHPFQDGNGMTRRIIMFRECLKNNIIPFIVQNNNKAAYITQDICMNIFITPNSYFCYFLKFYYLLQVFFCFHADTKPLFSHR